ncbi:MAG TPA: TonB-dependent receptor [Longimicrobiales bacterium]|nr:TonB-dependent receptor [Longimicrobiales bacterium]
MRDTFPAVPARLAAPAPPAAPVPFAALALALLALAPASASLAAQEAEDSTVYPVPGITVTALRMAVPRVAVPLNVSVVEGADLRARGVRSLAEALDDLPGITVVETGSFGGTTSLFVRGGESDYTRVLIDGVPVNSPGGGLDLAHLTVENVDRIEVVRGPSSVLYGSDAVAAVIEIHTREGSGPPTVDARARAGSFGTVDVAASVAGGRGRLSYSASVSNFETDGSLAFNNRYRNTEVGARVGLGSGETGTLALSLRHSDHDFHFPTDGAGVLADRNQFTAGARTVASLDAARALGPLRAELSLGAHDTEEGIRDAFDDEGDPESLRTDDHARRLLADARGHLDIGDRAVLTLGGLLERETLTTSLASESEFGPFESASDNERSARAAYGQVHATPFAGASVTGGLRRESNDAFGGFTTWRAGVVYAPARAVRLRASAGTGFKEPTFFENFSEGFARGNPDLVPEESRSWEVGFDVSSSDRRLAFSATYFDQEFRNLIDFTFAPEVEGDPNFFNIARADARGLELSGEADLGGGVAIAGDYTWLRTEVLDPGFDATADAMFAPGRALLRRPEHSWSGRFSWRSSASDVLSLEGRRVGEREDQDFTDFPARRVTGNAVFLLDASAEVPLLRGDGGTRLAAVMRVENLLDRAYENPLGFDGRGLTVLAGLRAGFGG